MQKLSLMKQDEEIVLFDVVKKLWDGKWTIVAFILISIVFGLAYSENKKKGLPAPHFAVLATYNVNLFSPFHSLVCGEYAGSGDFAKGTKQVLDCSRKRLSTDLEALAEGQWSRDGLIEGEWKAVGLNLDASTPKCREQTFCLILNTRSPLSHEIYNRQIQSYNEILTNNILGEVKAELSFQFKQHASSILASEAYAENIIKLRRLLNGIETGQMAINAGEIIVREVTPPHNQSIITSLAFVLGGFLGCALVLLRSLLFNLRNPPK